MPDVWNRGLMGGLLAVGETAWAVDAPTSKLSISFLVHCLDFDNVLASPVKNSGRGLAVTLSHYYDVSCGDRQDVDGRTEDHTPEYPQGKKRARTLCRHRMESPTETAHGAYCMSYTELCLGQPFFPSLMDCKLRVTWGGVPSCSLQYLTVQLSRQRVITVSQ